MNTAAKLKGILLGSVLLGTLALIPSAAQGAVFASMTMDGDFSDWAAVPVAFTDANEGYSKDINQIYLANDDDYLYIRITFNQPTNPYDGNGFYLSFDNDSNTATGWNVYGLGVMGSEVGYINDAAFQQTSASFNTSKPNSGAGAGIADYGSTVTSQEMRISRTGIINTETNELVFPNDSFNFAAYFNDADSDFAGAVSYTFAVPEPSAAGLLVLGGLPLLFRRRLKA